jgi:hypothetical protein
MTIKDGVEICRQIEDIIAPIGMHCGLTGSLLYRGKSTKDCDVIIYPHKKGDRRTPNKVMDALEAQGLVREYNRPAPYNDKLVWVVKHPKGRVDLFFL